MRHFRHLFATPVWAIVGWSIVGTGCTPRDSISTPATTSATYSEVTMMMGRIWQADPEMLKKLDEPQDVAGYRIRPPQGYRLQKTQQGSTQAFIWHGPPRADKSTPKLWVMVGKMSPDEEKLSFEKTSAMVNAGTKQKLDSYSETPAEGGQIGTLPFIRYTFKGTEKGSGHKGYVVVYHSHDGPQYIHIMVMDVETNFDSIGLMQAAALTFAKPEAKK